MTTDLSQFVRSQEFESLEEAWLQALENPGDHQPYCEVVAALCEMDMSSRALSLATPMVDTLADKGRSESALELAHTVVRLGAHNDNMARLLFDLLSQKYGEDDWFPLLSGRAELSADTLSTETLAEFDRMRRFTAGNVVYHPRGWKEGLVEGFDSRNEEVTVRFASGRTEPFPLNTILENFRPLDADDLRAMRLIAKPDLERMVTEDPSGLIQKAAQLRRGRITSTQVKAELCPSLIPTKKWATFWKKAKAAAAHDPWLQVEGTTTRPVFVLRTKPLSLVDEAHRAVDRTDDLEQRIGIIRRYLERCHEDSTKTTLVEMAREAVEDALSKDNAPHAQVLDGVLLLEHYGVQASVTAALEVSRMLRGSEDEFHPEAIDNLPTQESRDHAVSLLAEALGEGWVEDCIRTATRFPGSVVEQVVTLIVDAGHGPRLLETWGSVAPYPRRHPNLTYLLGRLYADGEFADQEGTPDPVTVGRVLLHLGRVLADQRRGSQTHARLLTRLTSLLVGRRNFLDGILQNMERDDLASYLGIAERGGTDFPKEILDVILRGVSNRFPDLTEKKQKPFWELDYVFVTSRGLQRQREEYRQLVEEKIAENSEAIGRAAAQGDLSENSEWEFAMEEQRNLTERASMMDQELRSAKLIEDQEIPDGIVAPGTEVSLVGVETGETQVLTILGPWDADGDSVINYRAPVAQSLLGKSVGEETTLQTLSPERMRIDAVQRIV